MSEQKKVYIRFGKIPPNERSINFIQVSLERNDLFNWDIKHGNIESAYKNIRESEFENGLSVFEMREDGLPEITNIRLFNSLKCRGDKEDIYEVEGDVIGLGNDGEPLLKNVKVLKNSQLTKLKLNNYLSSLDIEDDKKYFCKPFYLGKDEINKEVINKYFQYLKSIKDLNREVLGITLEDEKFLRDIPVEFWQETTDIIFKIKLETIKYDLEKVALKLLEIRDNILN